MQLTRTSVRWPVWPSLSTAWRGLREFFAYHGIWAPGVRLLRKLTVRAKVLIVLAIVAAPLAPLSVFVVVNVNQTVEVLGRKLASLRLVEANIELRAQITRRNLEENAKAPQAAESLGAAYLALAQASEAAIQNAAAMRTDWERLRPALEKAVQAEALPPADRVAALNAAYDASVTLSHLTVMHSDADTSADKQLHQQAKLSLDLLPGLQRALYRLRERVGEQLQGEPPVSGPARHNAAVRLAAAVTEARIAARKTAEELILVHRVGAAATDPLRSAVDFLELVESQMMAWDGTPQRARLLEAYVLARQDVHQLRTELVADAVAGFTAQMAAAERARAIGFTALAVSLVLAAYLLYCFFLVMRGGLVQLNQQMNRMAQGDLSARLTPLGVDEVATTMQAMTAALVRLSDLMASVRHGVGAVTQASQQVALGNADLQERHHATAQHIAAVVDGVQRYAEQLQACGRQVEAVVGTVQALRLESARNRKQMQRLRERMASLRGKSREIGEIVTLIDTIAFRTNILALNASVEASKAGEAGRGFAVVAQEVRSLAQRGADSARRIGDIVARSAEDIELSGALAEETGNALAAADEHVDLIHHAMDDVAGRTRSGESESATILAQLTEIKSGSDQGLRQVEQLTAASDALRSQGERLAHKVGQFRLS